MFWQIVFEFLGTLRGRLEGQRLRADHATNGAVAAVDTLNFNLDFLGPLAYSNVGVSKLNGSWEVFVQNSNFAFGIITGQSVIVALLGLGGVIELYPELKIRVPLLIINDWDFNLFLLLTLSKLNLLVDFLVVLGRDSGIIPGPDSNNKLLINEFLDNSDLYMAITLGN